jgi:hypothetical protein
LATRKRRKTHSSRDDPALGDVRPNGAIAGLTPLVVSLEPE